MDQGERRIRSLNLRGPDDSQLLRLRYGLEEAFRIASLPGLPPNATVLIRRLDLGTVRSGLSAVQLADSISEAVRSLAENAICIVQKPGNAADAVWFCDPLQPYEMLLLQLLDGKATDEWYWRSLFPDQTLSLDEQMISTLFIKACETPVKGLAVSLLIQSSLEPPRLSRLLPLLTPVLARRLLHEQGMSPLALSGSPAQTPSNQQSAFSESGSERLIEAPNLSTAWRCALQAVAQTWGHNDVRSRWLALQALLCYRPAYLGRRDTWHNIELSHWLQAWSVTVPDVNKEKDSSAEPLAGRIDSGVARDTGMVPDVNDAGIAVGGEPVSSPGAEGLAGPCTTARTDVQQESGVDAYASLVVGTERFSRHAGFAFVIPLLQRLGMSDLLQHHDALLAVDFPRQLLWTMATRFGLDEDDPCWRLFNDIEATPDAFIGRYCAPSLWWQLVEEARCSPRYVFLQATDMRVEDLINSFQLLCALFLRCHCDLSLRGLIHRPGRVTLSHTHWDVMFDINQTDLHLRRVALDSDPGWVPWLGRVVHFHYDSEGQGHV